jgi:hypothetical protein
MPANLVLRRHLFSRLAGSAASEYLQTTRDIRSRAGGGPSPFSLTQRREPFQAPRPRLDAILRRGGSGLNGTGMRSLLVILVFFTLAEPAAACRRYSIWHYNFPQPCLSDRPMAQAAPAALDIPLPDLTAINWGETGDGRLAAIGRLRALSGAR